MYDALLQYTYMYQPNEIKGYYVIFCQETLARDGEVEGYGKVEEYGVMGFTLDPKLTYIIHIHNFSIHTQKPLQIMKALTAIGCGKHNTNRKHNIHHIPYTNIHQHSKAKKHYL